MCGYICQAKVLVLIDCRADLCSVMHAEMIPAGKRLGFNYSGSRVNILSPLYIILSVVFCTLCVWLILSSDADVR